MVHIAVNEPHKAPFPPSFKKELCPLCYEKLMAAIAEALSKPSTPSRNKLYPEATEKDNPTRNGWLRYSQKAC
jgi:hypothetical protein